MIVCTGCGNANETRDEFCGSCGAYLEWHGERIGADPPAAAPPPVLVPTPERPGLIERVRYVVGLDDELAGRPHRGAPHDPPPPVTPAAHGPHLPPPAAPYPPPGPYPPAPPYPPPGPYPPAARASAPPATQTSAPPWPTAPVSPPPAGYPTGPMPGQPAGSPTAPPHGAPMPPLPAPPPPGPRPPLPGGPRPPLPAPQPAAPIGSVAGSAPVVPSAPVSPAVGPRAPEAEYERPPAQRPDPVDLGPADLYCGSCGGGNAAGRLYCRRCGTSLADPQPAARLPWWRRLFRRRAQDEHRPAKGGLAAGQRPEDWAKLQLTPVEPVAKPKRTWRFRLPQRFVLSRFALPLIGLSVIGMGLGPMRAKATEVVFDVYHAAKQTIAPEYVHVTPKSATASDAAKDHPASAVIDRNTASYWSDGRPGAAGSVLKVTFDRPIELAKVGFHNGAQGEDFPFQPRVRVVEVTYLERGQEVARKELEVGDKPQFQTFDFAARRVDAATVRVVSVYAGQKGSATSIAELSFLTVR